MSNINLTKTVWDALERRNEEDLDEVERRGVHVRVRRANHPDRFAREEGEVLRLGIVHNVRVRRREQRNQDVQQYNGCDEVPPERGISTKPVGNHGAHTNSKAADSLH